MAKKHWSLRKPHKKKKLHIAYGINWSVAFLPYCIHCICKYPPTSPVGIYVGSSDVTWPKISTF